MSRDKTSRDKISLDKVLILRPLQLQTTEKKRVKLHRGDIVEIEELGNGECYLVRGEDKMILLESIIDDCTNLFRRINNDFREY